MAKVFSITLMLAQKYSDDSPYGNRIWSQVLGLSASDLTRLERGFLEWVRFELYVREEEYAGFCRGVQVLAREWNRWMMAGSGGGGVGGGGAGVVGKVYQQPQNEKEKEKEKGREKEMVDGDADAAAAAGGGGGGMDLRHGVETATTILIKTPTNGSCGGGNGGRFLVTGGGQLLSPLSASPTYSPQKIPLSLAQNSSQTQLSPSPNTTKVEAGETLSSLLPRPSLESLGVACGDPLSSLSSEDVRLPSSEDVHQRNLKRPLTPIDTFSLGSSEVAFQGEKDDDDDDVDDGVFSKRRLVEVGGSLQQIKHHDDDDDDYDDDDGFAVSHSVVVSAVSNTPKVSATTFNGYHSVPTIITSCTPAASAAITSANNTNCTSNTLLHAQPYLVIPMSFQIPMQMQIQTPFNVATTPTPTPTTMYSYQTSSSPYSAPPPPPPPTPPPPRTTTTTTAAAAIATNLTTSFFPGIPVGQPLYINSTPLTPHVPSTLEAFLTVAPKMYGLNLTPCTIPHMNGYIRPTPESYTTAATTPTTKTTNNIDTEATTRKIFRSFSGNPSSTPTIVNESSIGRFLYPLNTVTPTNTTTTTSTTTTTQKVDLSSSSSSSSSSTLLLPIQTSYSISPPYIHSPYHPSNVFTSRPNSVHAIPSNNNGKNEETSVPSWEMYAADQDYLHPSFLES
jgi:hypothetical protein